MLSAIDNHTAESPQVLIVGAGPVGLSLAHFLHLSGVSFRIIEKRTSVATYSRAFAIQSRTLEILNLTGILTDLLTKGGRLEQIQFNGYDSGSKLFQLRMPNPNSSQAYLVGVMQSDTEKILEARLNKLGYFVERNLELIDLKFVDQVAKYATVKDLSNDNQENITFQYVVGCDGAKSLVRKLAGIKFEGDIVNLNFVCCDAKVTTDTPTIGFFFKEDDLFICWDYKQRQLKGKVGSDDEIINIKGDVVRLILPLREGEVEPDEKELKLKFKDIAAPFKFDVTEVVWLNTFKINERLASTHLQNNLMLCGDAAHVHSPAGGQGMNTGIQDAFNLAWKLSLQLQNFAKDDQLLETFNSERKDIAKIVLQNSGRTVRTLIHKPTFVSKLLRTYLAPILFNWQHATQKASDNISEVNLEYNTNVINIKNQINWTSSESLKGVGLRIPYYKLYHFNTEAVTNTHKFFNGGFKFQILLIVPTASLHLNYLYSTLEKFDKHPNLAKVCDLRIIIPTKSFSWLHWFNELDQSVNDMNRSKLEKLKLFISKYNSYLDNNGDLIKYLNLHKGTLSGVVLRPDFHTSKIFDGEFEFDHLVEYLNKFLNL